MLATIAAIAVCVGVARTVRAAPTAVLEGKVTHAKTREPVRDAIIILQCTCLQEYRELRTNAAGLYSFASLPPGTYTVQLLVGRVDDSRRMQLTVGQRGRADFTVDPRQKIVREIDVPDGSSLPRDPGGGLRIDMDHVKDIPVTGTDNDWSGVVQLSPEAAEGAAGNRIGPHTGGENKYVVDNANVNSPAFGTLGASIVQEFIEQVEVQESGYDAELGGASGGIISARRVSGGNKVRGQVVLRYTPRLAKPRFIVATDEALRVTQTPDHRLQAVIVASGPLIEDRLFWSLGVSPTTTWSTLVQKFHARVDRDGSGGFEPCPHANGERDDPDNDCAPGGNYIATEQFDSQKFSKFSQTGFFQLQYQAKLDWAINPKHRISVSVGGSPSFLNTSYRLPFSFDPNAFGTNPASDPLGGSSRVATGIVNDHFGTTRQNATSASLAYLGRVADDKLEIDAGFAFSQFRNVDAWKLDNPALKNIPVTQLQDTQGANLYELLDQDEATGFVPDAESMCNSRDLPGLACPVRTWLSGGLGEFGDSTELRAEGNLALTHFFSAAGAHQLKYGGQMEHVQRRIRSQYSGSNSDGFYDDCPAGQLGGGEWCYDPIDDDYDVRMSPAVNNHRFILVDTDNPDLRTAFGYGRVRKEQNDLRALATGIGAGARVDAYDETLASQNYAVFLQDKWAVLSNLYVNAGVRWELQDMRDILGDRALLIPDNVGPRLGVVYDWSDEGRSRLYASYGWFFQPIPLQMSSRVFGGLVNVQRNFRASDCVGKSVEGPGGIDLPKWKDAQPTEWCLDSPVATTGLTTGAVVPKLRGQYDQQFQVGYEQEVVEDLILGVQWTHSDLGRAVEDISTNGGLNFIIANPGVPVDGADIRAKQARCDSLQAELDATEDGDPRRPNVARELQQCLFLADAYQRVGGLFDEPSRNYDAWTFRLQKRFAHNWLLLASYTYSRLVGNYDGFVDPISGAINLGASSQYDIPELVRNSFGPLSFDQPHRVKVDGFYTFDLREAGRLTLGTSLRFASGYPISLRANNNLYASPVVHVLPRGAGGRVSPSYRWNLSAGYAYPLAGDLELELTARVINVTNARAVVRVDEVYSFQNARPVAGGDLADLKHTKIQSSSNPTEFFQRTILSPQGNSGSRPGSKARSRGSSNCV